MRIAVTSAGENLESVIDPRFGRCEYFLIIDTDSMSFETIPNEGMNAMGGAGIQAAQIVSNAGAKVLITGNIGPNAYQTLSAAGIEIITGARGIVKDVVESYKRGELKSTSGPNVQTHFGTGMGGMGQGGGGRGRGAGRGGGQGGQGRRGGE
jgi:predicted Fe-Mo cluster-binding NifX family protein